MQQTYKSLIERYGSDEKISYAELLNTIEWSAKRAKILKRDNEICTKCFQSATFTYNFQHFWFETVCQQHEFVHEDETIEIVETESLVTSIVDKPYHLHVHHKYYVLGKKPWEYPDDSLITLCNWCHWDFHLKSTVPVFRSERLIEKINLTPCYRCHGAGHFPEYDHVQGGVCFRCGGAKFEELVRIKHNS